MTSLGGRLLAFVRKRTIVTDVVQGIVVGGVLAFLTANLIINIQVKSMQTTVNGWSTTTDCGAPGNGLLAKAACAKNLPAANLPAEAAYWTTTVDGADDTLTGAHDYVLHFPEGGLPPNNAFWSLTMTDANRLMVANPINRYSLGDRSGLMTNTDGSTDIYLQAVAPAEHQSNWLPAPPGDFMLWLRAYQPGPTVLNGSYREPPVQETR
jgi:hypothetical protein